MFRFFLDYKKYGWWSILGTLIIIAAMWSTVQLDVKINEWFGAFYDALQKALTTPGSVTLTEYYGYMLDFGYLAGICIAINVIFSGFLVNHWTFRWRQSMADYYMENWKHARHIEGASQRVQEDTLKFARIMVRRALRFYFVSLYKLFRNFLVYPNALKSKLPLAINY